MLHEIRRFTNTGSGQTSGKLETGWRFAQIHVPLGPLAVESGICSILLDQLRALVRKTPF